MSSDTLFTNAFSRSFLCFSFSLTRYQFKYCCKYFVDTPQNVLSIHFFTLLWVELTCWIWYILFLTRCFMMPFSRWCSTLVVYGKTFVTYVRNLQKENLPTLMLAHHFAAMPFRLSFKVFKSSFTDSKLRVKNWTSYATFLWHSSWLS